jgi:hypothetical protein
VLDPAGSLTDSGRVPVHSGSLPAEQAAGA